jgi:hypothetical protein
MHDMISNSPVLTFGFQTTTSINNTVEDYVFNNAFASQYNYPPPPIDYNYRPHPYPDPSVQTTEQIAACCAPKHVYLSSARIKHSFTDNQNTPPSQIVSRYEQQQAPAYIQQRDICKTRSTVGENSQPTTERQRHILAPHQTYADTQPPGEPLGAIQPAFYAFRDGSTPYVPGHTARREDELQHMTDVMTTVIERLCFACDECRKKFKSRSDLR